MTLKVEKGTAQVPLWISVKLVCLRNGIWGLGFREVLSISFCSLTSKYTQRAKSASKYLFLEPQLVDSCQYLEGLQ